MDSWEESDTIAKLLYDESFEKSQNTGESLWDVSAGKSLHDELMEVGEAIPENFQVFSSISQTSIISKTYSSDEEEHLVKVYESPSSHSSIDLSTQHEQVQFGLKESLQLRVVQSEKKVRPPPGFSKPFLEPKKQCIPSVDSINRNEKVMFQKNNVDNCIKTKVKPPPGFQIPPKHSVKDYLEEFKMLSELMDIEISRSIKNAEAVRDQRESVKEEFKYKGKVDVLKAMLCEEREKLETAKRNHEQSLDRTREKHQKDIEHLQVRLREKEEDSRCLQKEFNKALNERECEIESLYVEVNNLQSERQTFEGGPDEIAMEVRERLQL